MPLMPVEFGRSYLQALQAEDEHQALRTIVELADLTRSHPATGLPTATPVEEPTDHAWRDRAACRGLDPELFFPPRGDTGPEARAVCADCPVQDECLTWALERDERFGIWGGQTQRSLNRIRSVPRRSRCRGCHRNYLRVQKQILYCDDCRIERGDKRWFPAGIEAS